MLVDSHSHLDFLPRGKAGVDDLEGALKSAKDGGVGKIITIGTSLKCSRDCIEIAKKSSSDYLKIYATCGLHPKDAKGEIKNSESTAELVDELKQLARSENFVAIGETGLDYYGSTGDSEKKLQRELFEGQVKLARELDLPLVIHCRNAWEEIFQIISNFKLRGVFHCWTGDWRSAKKALDLGFYISFSGLVTFKNAAEIQDVAKKAPLEKILIETDSPFLAPEPVRGSINEPKNVKIVGQFISSLRNQPFEEIANATSSNAERLFGI